jgi:hypothetical protein
MAAVEVVGDRFTEGVFERLLEVTALAIGRVDLPQLLEVEVLGP